MYSAMDCPSCEIAEDISNIRKYCGVKPLLDLIRVLTAPPGPIKTVGKAEFKRAVVVEFPKKKTPVNKTTANTGGDKVWIATKKLFVSLKEFINAVIDYCTY